MFASSRVVLRFFEINRRRLTLSSDGTQPVPRRFASVRFGHRSVFTALVVVVYVVLCGTVRPVIPVFFPIRRVRFLLLLLEIVRCGRSNPIGSLRFAVVVLVVVLSLSKKKVHALPDRLKSPNERMISKRLSDLLRLLL